MSTRITKRVKYLTKSCDFIKNAVGGADVDLFFVYDISIQKGATTNSPPFYEVKYIIRGKNTMVGCIKSYIHYTILNDSRSIIVRKINAVLRNLKYLKLNDDEDILDITNLDESKKNKLHDLRSKKNEFDADNFTTEVNRKYASKFKVGDLISHNNNKGIIDEKISERRYKIKIKDDYYDVDGLSITLREHQDLSHIPIDPALNKLNTKSLLKMLKARRHKGKLYGDALKIKRVLSEREHVRK